MELTHPDLARPFAPHRLKIYVVLFSFVGAVFAFMTIAAGTGLVAPSLAVDVAANLIFGTPVIVLPFVLLWKAPGEQRSRLALAAELIMVYIPLTAGSQLTYELPFLIGHPFNLWGTTSDPGWRWLWWQYGLADTRYRSDDNFIFGLEFGAVLVGILLFVVWTRMLRRDLRDESRIRCLWLSFFGVAVLITGTTAYYVAEVRAGFSDIRSRGIRILVQVHRGECALSDPPVLRAIRHLLPDRSPDPPRRARRSFGRGVFPIRITRRGAIRTAKPMTASLAGKVAIVTGGVSGLGRGIVERFVDAGAQVIIADLNDHDGEHLASECGARAFFSMLMSRSPKTSAASCKLLLTVSADSM